MSTSFYQSVKRTLSEIIHFVNVTLEDETLSPTAQQEKEKIFKLILKLYNENESVITSGDDRNTDGHSAGSTSSAKESGGHSAGSVSSIKDSGAHSAGSVSSIKDSGGHSAGSVSSIKDSGGHSAGSVSSLKDSGAHSAGSTSSAKDIGIHNSGSLPNAKDAADDSHNGGGDLGNDDNSEDNIPETDVKSLTNPLKTGYLEKKHKVLLTSSWQKRFFVLHNNVLYCFKKHEDKKQQFAFYVTGYEFRDISKDAGKKDFCFELVCPTKKSYQFAALSKEELEGWRKALQATPMSNEYEDDRDIYDVTNEIPDVPKAQPYLFDNNAEYNDATSVDSSAPKLTKFDVPNNSANYSDNKSLYEDGRTEVTPAPLPPTRRIPPPLPDLTEDAKKCDDNDEEYVFIPDVNPAPPLPNRSVPLPPTPLETHQPQLPADEESEDIYVDPNANPTVSPPPLPSRNIPLPLPPGDVRKPTLTPTLRENFKQRSEDHENLFYGKWKCESSGPTELSFKSGDIIHIISRDLEKENWWVGELGGKIGLVPVSYLTPAYELVH
ncbi:src kinase-associated phosphoprotein 2-like [Physella acuta]|uniref:src kinase-associated phosphoprotein 2-like n=1 Tax=Physella acuta TaxID=109671 RepID=UPI0027DBD224|nr:src kinase-associated phosphoprotein 2-like [Physella acuta]